MGNKKCRFESLSLHPSLLLPHNTDDLYSVVMLLDVLHLVSKLVHLN